MYIYMFTSIYVYIYIYVYAHIYINTCILYIYMLYLYTYTCVYICWYSYISSCPIKCRPHCTLWQYPMNSLATGEDAPRHQQLRLSDSGWFTMGLGGFHVVNHLPSGKLRVCYWKWSFIVDFPIRNGDFP